MKILILIRKRIRSQNITSGKFLDLSTGPGRQATLLAKRGFRVIGSDLSEAAIRKARNVYAN